MTFLAALACGAFTEGLTFLIGERAGPADEISGITSILAILAIAALFVFETIAAWLIGRTPRRQTELRGTQTPGTLDATTGTAFVIIVAGFAAVVFAAVDGLIVQPTNSSFEGLLIAVTTVLAGIPLFFVVLPLAIPERHFIVGALLPGSSGR